MATRIAEHSRRYAGAGRRIAARYADRAGDGAYEPVSQLRPAAVTTRVGARLVGALGQLLLAVEQPRRGQRLFELALRLDPGSAKNAVGLGDALLTGGPDGIMRLPTAGLVAAPVGDATESARWCRAAIEMEPDSRAAWTRLVAALERRGLHDEALSAIREHLVDGPTSQRLEAAVIDRAGRARGAHRRTESADMVRLWTAPSNARDASTRQLLVRHLVQIGEFEEACRVAGAGGPEACPDPPLSGLTDDALYALHARRVADGAIDAGLAYKRELARRKANAVLLPAPPVRQIVEKVQATSYLDGTTRALETLDAIAPRLLSRRERLVLRKLRADLALAAGDLESLSEVRTELASYSPSADRRFEKLVTGADVLVLGPSPTGRPDPSELADFDLAVVTKRWPEGGSSVPTIVYPNDASARLEEMIDRQHRSTMCDVLVLRPSIIAHGGAPIPESADIRLMPAEDANTFLGTRFAIQRILYDLVGRGAASITLAGVDFFLADRPYLPGYSNEIDSIFEPNGLQPVRSVAPHDYLWDFKFTRHLHDLGLIRAGSDIAKLLGMDDAGYTARLTERLSTARLHDEAPVSR